MKKLLWVLGVIGVCRLVMCGWMMTGHPGSMDRPLMAAHQEKDGSGTVKTQPFGEVDGQPVELYTLTNNNGMQAKVMTYGALLTHLRVSDNKGQMDDVVLGYDDLASYLKGHPYFGATVGRVANRVAKGRFTLDGKEYKLATNNGPNALHGGLKGFDKVIWKAKILSHKDGPAVEFTYTSPDGEEGYPGQVRASVIYILTSQNELRLEYSATCDQPTPINLTHHSYFNLAGQGDILGHELFINADQYTPVDDTLIPTGQLAPVKGTPLDFTNPTTIGARIAQLTGEPGGYDHNFVLRQPTRDDVATVPLSVGKHEVRLPHIQQIRLAATVYEPKSGRVMDVLTTEPGLQFYSGNFLDGSNIGKGNTKYLKHYGFCLETQHFPDSVNHANFPNTILKPGESYTQTTLYRFSAR